MFRDTDARLQAVVGLYHEGRIAPGDIGLSERMKKKVEDIFLGGGISGKLLERISPPHTFPVDTAGKARDLYVLTGFII